MFPGSGKEINRLIAKGMSNTYLNRFFMDVSKINKRNKKVNM